MRAFCLADTLHIWFPARWARCVIRRLHEREYSLPIPAWFDQPDVDENLRQKQQEAKASRVMSFKLANFGASDILIPVVSGLIGLVWLCKSFLDKLPIKREVLARVFRTKDASPWGNTRSDSSVKLDFLINCASFRRSATSNKVTGTQSLSGSTTCTFGKDKTKSSKREGPVQVWCTWCSPLSLLTVVGENQPPLPPK